MTVEDEIVRYIDLNAPQEKVWRAITDSKQFGEWFQCKVDGEFAPGGITNCHSEHGGTMVHWQIRVVAMDAESYFAYHWSPGDTGADLLDESVGQTKVEFSLVPTAKGTRLTIRESGFATLPPDMHQSSFRRNTEGWDAQVKNISAYVE